MTADTFAAKNNCQNVSPSVTTFWGNNNNSNNSYFILDGGDKISRRAKGLLSGKNGKPASGVLVEIFAAADEGKPRLIGPEYRYPRVAACTTGLDGRFHFPDLPPGRYELILSKYNRATMVIPIEINPNARKYATKKFKIYY